MLSKLDFPNISSIYTAGFKRVRGIMLEFLTEVHGMTDLGLEKYNLCGYGSKVEVGTSTIQASEVTYLTNRLELLIRLVHVFGSKINLY